MGFRGANMERKAPNWRGGKELTGFKSGRLPRSYLAGGNIVVRARTILPSGRKQVKRATSLRSRFGCTVRQKRAM
jgi:hypothetical protein